MTWPAGAARGVLPQRRGRVGFIVPHVRGPGVPRARSQGPGCPTRTAAGGLTTHPGAGGRSAAGASETVAA